LNVPNAPPLLQPYQIVKDHRTGWESGNVGAFLGGETLTEAILAALRHHRFGASDDGSSGGRGGDKDDAAA